MGFWIKLRRWYRENIFSQYSFRGIWRVQKTISDIAQRGIPKISSDPENIFDDREWDNLLVLDGCRHDLYQEVEGEIDSRISVGSRTPEFIERVFSEGDFSDVVLVTGNPYFSPQKFRQITGRELEDVFHEVFHTYMEDWNKEKGTVLPEPLIRDAKTAKKLFPDEKLFVHFMQPHNPFVDSDLEGHVLSPDLDVGVKDYSVWEKAEMGKYSQGEVWREYRKNLEFILPKVKALARELEGETFLTSDHGNLVGENDLYGHQFPHSRAEPLRKVPWHKID